MTTVQISDELHAAVRREAKRRGVQVDVIVAEAVQRFVVGSNLHELLAEFDRRDATDPGALSEGEAARVASEELAAFRRARS